MTTWARAGRAGRFARRPAGHPASCSKPLRKQMIIRSALWPRTWTSAVDPASGTASAVTASSAIRADPHQPSSACGPSGRDTSGAGCSSPRAFPGQTGCACDDSRSQNPKPKSQNPNVGSVGAWDLGFGIYSTKLIERREHLFRGAENRQIARRDEAGVSPRLISAVKAPRDCACRTKPAAG